MASADGGLSPPAYPSSAESSVTPSAKRKRDQSCETENIANVAQNADSKSAATTQTHDQFIQDLIDVLRSEDTTPSVLTRLFSDSTSSAEPQSKRQKGEDGVETKTTILTRYTSSAYENVDEILRDIDLAVADIKDMLQSRNGALQPQYIPESEIGLRITAFKDRAHNLVRWEKAARAKVNTSADSNGSTSANGTKQSTSKPEDNKIVLTVYGNAPGPKQLFSSLQKSTRLDGNGTKIRQPLRESALPGGVTTTQIIPVQSTGVLVGDKKRVQTLGELFPAPANLPSTQPPKPSKTATTRSNVVGWYQPAPKDASPRATGYLTQNIVAGQWLDYSKSTTPQDAKRRHRDRAMSLGGSKATQPDFEPVETEASKLDALFRSAYSGFAPTKDESAAVVSEGHTNRIWWQKTGERSYERLVENAEHILEVADIDPEITDTLEELDLEKLQEIADMNEDTIDPSLVALGGTMEKSAQDKEAEEVLADISDLLETLNSYQRIRHLSLNAASRPGGILSTSDTSSSGTPSKPSESEQATYETLKAALKLMVETLPPYAVAKLDPDRLADLRISTKIEVELEDYKGVMEEDEASARARAALAAVSSASRATSAAPLHRTSSSNQVYGNQYSGQQTTSSQFYRPNQTPIRPPSSNIQRQPATISAPYQPRPVSVPSPAYRPGYGTPTYPSQNHQNARPTALQYGAAGQQYHQTASPQPYMRPQSQSQPYSQTPQVAPQSAMNGGYPRQSFSQQGQPAQNGLNYQYNPGNHLRQASPHKMYSPQQTPVQPRPYGTTTPTPSHGPTRAPYLQNAVPPTQMNGSQSQTPQPSFQRQNSGPMNYSTYMTSAEQTSLLERQKAQLAQQQGMQQQQARTAAQAALGSPSKGAVNGNYPVAAGQ